MAEESMASCLTRLLCLQVYTWGDHVRRSEKQALYGSEETGLDGLEGCLLEGKDNWGWFRSCWCLVEQKRRGGSDLAWGRADAYVGGGRARETGKEGCAWGSWVSRGSLVGQQPVWACYWTGIWAENGPLVGL